jgi:hypothetical protein
MPIKDKEALKTLGLLPRILVEVLKLPKSDSIISIASIREGDYSIVIEAYLLIILLRYIDLSDKN